MTSARIYYDPTWEAHTGASYLEAMRDGAISYPPHLIRFGLRVTQAAEGELDLRWDPTEDQMNPHGAVHGGFVAAVLDVAAGLACATTLGRFVHLFTQELRVDFVRPVTLIEAPYRIEGRVVRHGRSTFLADGSVGPGTNLLARASGTFVPNRRTVAKDRWPEAGL